MAIDIASFKTYSGWPTEGTQAVGLLVIARSDPATTNVITIPKGTRFAVYKQGVQFETLEATEVGESQARIEILVRCTERVARGNIPLGQEWSSSLMGVTLSNPAAFTEGKDRIAGGLTAGLLAQSVSDANIQNHLNTAKAQVRTLCGFGKDDPDPDDIRFEHAVYCQSLYAIEQTSSQRITREMDFDGDLKERRSHFPRDGQLAESIRMKILNLIAPLRKVESFMPAAPNAQAVDMD